MKLGLTYTGTDKKHQNYVQWLKEFPNVEVIKLCEKDNNIHDLDNCDGIVLSGGIDIHPQYYNNQELYYLNAPKEFNEKRDAFETSVFKKALEFNKPILGICRGMQLINCILGGNLQQDLAELNMVHRAEPNDKAHGLNVHKESLLFDIVKVERSITNSAHHQAIKNLGKGLKINCFADDGVVEGMEWENRYQVPFLLCVQWHPERLIAFGQQNSPLCKSIRNVFMEEIKKTKSRP